MRRRKPRQRSQRSQDRAPWWRQHVAQLVVGLILAAAGALFGFLFTQLETPAPQTRCNTSSDPITDYQRRTFNMRYYCSTDAESIVYGNVLTSQAAEPLDDTGLMWQAPSVWVLCQWKGRPNPILGGKTNTWWLYTQADRSRPNTHGYTAAWGYLPATVVTESRPNAPVPGVRACPEYY